MAVGVTEWLRGKIFLYIIIMYHLNAASYSLCSTHSLKYGHSFIKIVLCTKLNKLAQDRC